MLFKIKERTTRCADHCRADCGIDLNFGELNFYLFIKYVRDKKNGDNRLENWSKISLIKIIVLRVIPVYARMIFSLTKL